VKLDAYCQSLTKVIEALTKIDDTLVFWPYEYPNSPESELLNNPTSLGYFYSSVSNFLGEFCINKALSLSYVNCLVGFNMDYEWFMESATVMLEDIPAKMYKCTLQVPHIAPLGWLFGTHEDISTLVMEQLLNNTWLSWLPTKYQQSNLI